MKYMQWFSRPNRHGTGFTLLEFILAFSLMILLLGAAIPLYGNLQWTTRLNEASGQIVSDVRLARELSAARYNDSHYGVFFEVFPTGADRVVFFRGTSYATRNPAYDRVTALADTLKLETSFSGGSSELVFSKNTGLPTVTGTFSLTHTLSGAARVFSINAYGVVDSQ